MSRSGESTFEWGGEPERVFRLGLGEIRKIQEKTGCGPLGIVSRCAISMAAIHAHASGDYVTLSRLDLAHLAEKSHTREVVLQGLLGTGMPAPEAHALVRDWGDERPLQESLGPAAAIAGAVVYGVEE